MSDRICFIGNKGKDISNVVIPKLLEEYAKYIPERNLIFTYIKTIEFYGANLYGITPDYNFVDAIKKWAKDNDLIITSDYKEAERNKIICFKSNKYKDISNIIVPELIEKNAYYNPEKNIIFTHIKVTRFYGDKLYGIAPDYDFVNIVKKWAKDNDLIIASGL